MIEYWDIQDHQFPEAAVKFAYKTETDLFALAKAKTRASSLAVSSDGSQFAMFCADRYVNQKQASSMKLTLLIAKSALMTAFYAFVVKTGRAANGLQ